MLLDVEPGCTMHQFKQLFASQCSPKASMHPTTCTRVHPSGICIYQQPTLSPAPFYQTALAGKTAEELQHLHSGLITYAHTGGMLTHLRSEPSRMKGETDFVSAMSRLPQHPESVFRHTAQILIAKLTYEGASGMAAEAMRFEALHGLWEIFSCYPTAAAAAAIAEVCHRLCASFCFLYALPEEQIYCTALAKSSTRYAGGGLCRQWTWPDRFAWRPYKKGTGLEVCH
jgi:hypothetical protein